MTRRHALAVVALAALGVGVTGFAWGTYSAGGADPYGYVGQADLWARGDLVVEQPIATELPWPEVDATLAPLGFRPGLEPGTTVPLYPAGLPIVMALFQVVAGPTAVFWVAPMFGMLAVVAAGALALRLGGPTAGAFAALLLVTSPTLLFSVTWPMSDAVATGWWALVALWVTRTGTRSAAAAGVASALAILTRPNLVAVALVPFAYLGARAVWSRRREHVVPWTAFSVLTAVGCLAVAALHTTLYGSPFASGYGDLDLLFETTRRPYNPDGPLLRPLLNLRGFVTRPLEVEPGLLLSSVVGGVAVLAGSVFGGRLRPGASEVKGESARAARGAALLCGGLVGAVLASYLFFRSFPEWWYLRLLLPAYPPAAVLGGIGIAWIAGWLRPLPRVALLLIVSLLIGYDGANQALERDIYRTWHNEARYEAVGHFVADELPENAVMFATQHSGSLRYYADRLTIRFDVLHGEWLQQATNAVRDLGYEPYYVVEGPEREMFNLRFAGVSRLGALGWTPVAEFRGPTPVWIFKPADHPAFGGSEPPVTRIIDLSLPESGD